jgi:hypothetical protein
MVRNAIITFILLSVMFFTSFYLVLSANRILDRTMGAIMKNEGITVTAQEKALPLSKNTEMVLSKNQ